MSQLERVMLGIATIVVAVAATLWIADRVQQARSPEAKCVRVMNDIERERSAPIDPSTWLSTYNDCVARERGGDTVVRPNASPEEFCQAIIDRVGAGYPASFRQSAYDDCVNKRRASTG